MSEKSLPLIKNQILTLKVESLCGNGSGIAKTDGFVVFIPHTAAGDVAEVKIIKVTKSYAVGKLQTLLIPSPDRQEPVCPQAQRCGGCCFQHIRYDVECGVKQAMIEDCFARIANLPIKLQAFLPADAPLRYRNKAIYPIAPRADGSLCAGFYAPMSHRIIEHDDCPIGPKVFSEIQKSACTLLSALGVLPYDEASGSGAARGIYLRENAAGKVLFTLIINSDGIGDRREAAFAERLTKAHPEISGILFNINKLPGNVMLGDTWRTVWGENALEDVLCGKHFRIAPASFYQVNRTMAEKLYDTAKALAGTKPGEVLFDLYCGTGTIGIIFAENGAHLIGVETVKDAVEDAAQNARRNGVDAEFLCLDAASALDHALLAEKKPDVIVIDPPRKGCGSDTVKKISAFGASRIVYISCDPHTLARDLADFVSHGYDPKTAVGVDLFPRTAHVETVCLLSNSVSDSISKSV